MSCVPIVRRSRTKQGLYLSMFKSDDELKFSYHLDKNQVYFVSGNTKSNKYFRDQALHSHALSVWGGAQDLITKVIVLSERYSESEAKIHLRYGLGRRTRTIWQSFRFLYTEIQPDRVETLSIDQAVDGSTMLNSLYINIRGALDNFALCAQDLLWQSSMPKLKQHQIGLFNPIFLKQHGFERVRDIVEDFKLWDTEFKKKRDPAAHRVPLSILPAIHTKDSIAKFQAIENDIGALIKEANAAANKAEHDVAQEKFATIKNLRADQEKLGMFEPCFQYDPNESPIYLYPTVSEDVGQFVILARKLISLLEELPAK
jgi:hypothetical protein